jgi:type III secretion system YscQ/HrcQ family protein
VLSVPLVIGLSLVNRAELRRLEVGSAFVPGEGLFVDRAANGLGVLAAATAERGVRVELSSAEGIVLRDETLALAPDVEVSGDAMDESNDVNQTLTDAVLEAPVVVRIELAAVSMTAGDWAKLRPGDVIETGRRVAEPVLLRVGGRVVARGELVDIEGELGVRVRELAGTSDP